MALLIDNLQMLQIKIQICNEYMKYFKAHVFDMVPQELRQTRWYQDWELLNRYNITTQVNSDLRLYATTQEGTLDVSYNNGIYGTESFMVGGGPSSLPHLLYAFTIRVLHFNPIDIDYYLDSDLHKLGRQFINDIICSFYYHQPESTIDKWVKAGILTDKEEINSWLII